MNERATLSTESEPCRNFGLTPDNRRELACPAKGGETIAAGRCLEMQENGCYCPRARAALDSMHEVATERTIWVKAEPRWKHKLELRVIDLKQRADALDAKGVSHAVPR